jgi:hypothetical protein
MIFIRAIRKSTTIGIISFLFFILACSCYLLVMPEDEPDTATLGDMSGWDSILCGLFKTRNDCMLSRDFDTLETIFLTDESTGRWAFENEIVRSDYLHGWSGKQGVEFLNIESKITILRCRAVGRGYAFYVLSADEYSYAYKDDTSSVNTFRFGAYHSIDLIPGDEAGTWVISREWYDDPWAKVFSAYDGVDEITRYIAAGLPTDISDIDQKRMTAVAYADAYCGAASDGENGYSYNKKYTNYNSLGGDCANFASQVLFEGGGFKKNITWNYKSGKGSWAWIKAQGLKDYLIYSGKGSYIATGKYEKVYKYACKLLPGDMVVYARKGKITHVSIVTGLDSKGCPLVNSHNLDRYRVPWDIGWNTSDITFYLIRVHY